MANDPNKSNKGTPNTLDDSGFSDIERIGQRSGRHTAEDIAQRMRLAEANRRVGIFEEGLAAGPSERVAAEINRALSRERQMVNTLEPRINLRQETNRQRYTDLTQSVINRTFGESTINGQSAEFSRSTSGQRISMGMMGQSYETLEMKRASAINSIGALGQRASSIAEDLYNERGQQDPARLAQLQTIYAQKNRLINRVGSIDAAQRLQRSMGLDPESQTDALFGAGQRAERTMFRASVANELAGGGGDLGGKSIDQLKQREIQLAGQLVEELNKLKNSVGKSAEEIDKMKAAASDTADNLKKTEEAIRQVGGGGGGNRYNNLGNALNFAGNAFGAVGGAVQAIGVNQRLGQVMNVAGFAGIENQKYQMYKSAAGGDVASQLALSQWGSSEGFGGQLSMAANVALGAQGIGSGLQSIAGGLRIAGGGGVNNRLQGAGDLIQGVSGVAVAGADYYGNVSGGAANIAGVNAQMQARMALSAVTAEQLQGFRDFGVGMSTAAIGMGGRAGGFLDRTINKANMQQMVNSRISPEQMAQMAQMGVANIGSTFNEGQIFSARGLERSGFGTMGENMQRMANLASAGSNNPQAGLASVLEAALGKSLDGSKVLNMMAENTGAMVQSSAGRAMGIDVTGASAQILAAGVNTADPNKEYAMQRAASAAERMRQIGTDTGTNFAAMSATARISKMTGMSGTEAIIAQQLDDQTLRAMKNMKPNEIRDKMFDRGINVAAGKESETVDALIKAHLISNAQLGGAGLATGVAADKIARGEKLTREEQLAYNRASVLSGFAGGSEAMRAGQAIRTEEPNQVSKDKVTSAMKGELGTDQQRTLDDMRTQGFKQLSQAALEATAGFKDATQAIKALGALAKSVEGVGDAGGEGKFKTAAADSAGTFGKSTMTFKESVTEFQRAVDMLVKRSNISSTNLTKQTLDEKR